MYRTPLISRMNTIVDENIRMAESYPVKYASMARSADAGAILKW